MRFNSKEVAYLGQQASNNYDREGFLFIKQKNDKLFKKGEGKFHIFFYILIFTVENEYFKVFKVVRTTKGIFYINISDIG